MLQCQLGASDHCPQCFIVDLGPFIIVCNVSVSTGSHQVSGDAESASIPVPGHTAPPPDPVQRQDALTTAESRHLAGGHFQTGTDVPLSLWWLVLSGAFSVHLLCTDVLFSVHF